MSRGLGKVERAVLEFVGAHRHAPEGDVAVYQYDMVEELTKDQWHAAAIRRAVITLVCKGLLYKFDDRNGVLLDIEPITHKLGWGFVTRDGEQRWRREEFQPVEPRRVLPDFEALVIAELGQGDRLQSGLGREILLSSEGCWRNLRGKHGLYPTPEDNSRLAYYRAVERMAKSGKIRRYRKANKYGRPGAQIWLSLNGAVK